MADILQPLQIMATPSMHGVAAYGQMQRVQSPATIDRRESTIVDSGRTQHAHQPTSTGEYSMTGAIGPDSKAFSVAVVKALL